MQRDDVSVLWNLSPRVVRVAMTSDEIAIQDLHDTLRELEQRPENMVYPSLISSAGKEQLGGGVRVGVTSTLFNARLSFEARRVSVCAGSITSADPAGCVLTDASAHFVSDGVAPGAWVVNLTDGSICSVLTVDSETQLSTDVLGDGADNKFDFGDSYKMWNVVQVGVSGGNLVAVNAVGGDLSCILPTAGTQVVRTSSSSATLQEMVDIQQASFNNTVMVDVANSTGLAKSGTAYPAGTGRQPCLYLADAMVIRGARGLPRIDVVGDLTIDLGASYQKVHFKGQSQNRSIITVTSAADVLDCEFSDCHVKGVLDGGCLLRDCLLDNLEYVDGLIVDCTLAVGTITLSGADRASFFNCRSGVVGCDCPYIDLGGAGSELSVRNYNGGLALKNKSGAEHCNIDFNTGRLIVDATVGGTGIIVVRGPCGVDNYGTAEVVVVNTLSNLSIAEAVWDELLAGHTVGGTAGKTLAEAAAGLTPEQQTKLAELHALMGLNPAGPLMVSSLARTAPGIVQSITRVGGVDIVKRE